MTFMSAIEIVNYLFEELSCICPTFYASFPTAESMTGTKRAWCRGLADNNVNNFSYLERGIQQYRDNESPYFPKFGQFLLLCMPKPEELGIPDPEIAYRECLKNMHPPCENEVRVWSHPVVKEAYMQSGDSFTWRNNSGERHKALFLKNYEQCVSEALRAEGDRMKTLSNDKDSHDRPGTILPLL